MPLVPTEAPAAVLSAAVVKMTFGVSADIGEDCMYMLLRTLALAVKMSSEVAASNESFSSFPVNLFGRLLFIIFHLLLNCNFFVIFKMSFNNNLAGLALFSTHFKDFLKFAGFEIHHNA